MGKASGEVGPFRQLETDFLYKVKQAHRLAMIKRQKMKTKKHGKTLEPLGKCKKHNGPITPKTLDILDIAQLEAADQ